MISTFTHYFQNRKIICKIRASHHLLEIEREKYKNIKRDERIFCHSSLSEIEDDDNQE